MQALAKQKNIDYNPSSDYVYHNSFQYTCTYYGLFTAQLIWAEEFARYLMIWMAFIGAALVMQEDGHYKMTAVVDACLQASEDCQDVPSWRPLRLC